MDGKNGNFVTDGCSILCCSLHIVSCLMSGQLHVHWWNMMRSGASCVLVKPVNTAEARILALNSSFIPR